MNTKKIILYSFRRCPYAMRARMALSYANIEYQHREILLKNKPKSMIQFSPKGTVPLLVDRGRVIDESLDVMTWALAQQDADNWMLQHCEKSQKQALDLIRLCDDRFKKQLDCYKYSDRHELSEIQYRQQSLWFLELLNARLKKNGCLIGGSLSVADFAIFPFIRQFAFVNKNWFDGTDYQFLQKWLGEHLISNLFLSIMKKYPLWKD